MRSDIDHGLVRGTQGKDIRAQRRDEFCSRKSKSTLTLLTICVRGATMSGVRDCFGHEPKLEKSKLSPNLTVIKVPFGEARWNRGSSDRPSECTRCLVCSLGRFLLAACESVDSKLGNFAKSHMSDDQPSANERDHKKLGRELDLFTFSDAVGKGLPLWTPRGSAIRRELERFIVDEEIRRGYAHVYTPDIAKLDLYRKSGHYPHYQDSMYAPIVIDDEEFMLRPMTCPHHFELYLSRPHSYRELPMRIAELAKLYRYEQSGELMGLQRVRSFCLADAHIICASEEQAGGGISKAL